jgi:cation transport ATPase
MFKPTIVSIVALDGLSEGTLLALAAGVARALEPLLGAAILESAREREVESAPVERVQKAARSGVVASIGGQTVVVGTAALFRDLGLSVSSLGDGPDRLQQRGQHVLFVAVDGHTTGFLGVLDAGM